MAHFYHCATKGFDHCILFENEQEFIAGMNRIAICLAIITGIKLIAFCLMDNHVHFILHGSREDCLRWMGLFHRLTMIWQKYHRKTPVVDEEWVFDAWQIVDQDDLINKIIYVHRNPTVAGMGILPTSYRWGSASLLFMGKWEPNELGRKIGTMSGYESRKTFGTQVSLPPEWICLPNGMIWPGSYTEYKMVDKLFGHPWKYLYALNQNVEATINQQMWGKHISLPDQEIVEMTQHLSFQLFGTEELSRLDIQQRLLLCKEVKKRFGTSIKQMSRVFHIGVNELKMIFG